MTRHDPFIGKLVWSARKTLALRGALRKPPQAAPAVPEELRLAWEQAALAAVAPELPPRPLPKQYAPSQYTVLI